jgi:hypothetical protein
MDNIPEMNEYYNAPAPEASEVVHINHVHHMDLSSASQDELSLHMDWGYTTPGWYFSHEDEATCSGPYETQALAAAGLEEYCKQLTQYEHDQKIRAEVNNDDHAFRLLTVDEPLEHIYAVVYGGNGYGRGCVLEVLELSPNEEEGCWISPNQELRIFTNGAPCQIAYNPGPDNFNWSMYCSPNRDDVTRFKVAFEAAGNMLCKKFDSSEKPRAIFVQGIGTSKDGTLMLSPSATPLPLIRGADDKFRSDACKLEFDRVYGFQSGEFQLTDEVKFTGEIFVSTDRNQVYHYGRGIQATMANVKLASPPEPEAPLPAAEDEPRGDDDRDNNHY